MNYTRYTTHPGSRGGRLLMRLRMDLQPGSVPETPDAAPQGRLIALGPSNEWQSS